EFSRDGGFLQRQFALIREAREWLRSGNELGFGGLADPEMWLAKIEGIGVALEPAEFLDAASLLETSGWLRGQFREEAAKFPLLSGAAWEVGDFREVLAAIRRSILPNGDISDDASTALRRIRVMLVQLGEDEAAEILRILRELTERLQAVRPVLLEAAETIAMLDGVFARARFARDFDAALPEFSDGGELRLEAARHPVLEDKLKRE